VHDRRADGFFLITGSAPDRDLTGSSGAVRGAIVVPAYRQPGLLVEALDSALAQRTDFAYAIIVVNDGCPFEETDHVCRDFAAVNPEKVYYLRTRNSGLSAARNTGIEFALAAFPVLDSIYFLDADNRMQPRLLQSLFDALQRSGPKIGWAYPDVDKFGFSEFCDTSGPYSALENLFRNFCEAGSMVSRRMLDAGVRFDENMRDGSEDWEFWLQGLDHGFRGVHVPAGGFRYRRRGESTLVESERNYRPILDGIRVRHPRLFDVRAMVQLEAAVSHRYALYLPDRESVRCITDVDAVGEDISVDAFVKRLLRSSERPDYGACPSHVVVLNSALFDWLRGCLLDRAVLWNLERMLLQCTFIACRISREEMNDQRGTEWRGEALPFDLVPAATTADGDIHIAAMNTQTLVRSLQTQVSAGLEFDNEPWKAYHRARLDIRLRLPAAPAPPQAGAVDALADLCAVAARTWARDEYGGWSSAQIDRYRCGIAMPADFYGGVHHIPSVLPLRSRDPARQVALVIDPPRSELTLAALGPFAAQLRQQGWAVHLVGLGRGELVWSNASHELFASIIPFPLSLPNPERTGANYDNSLGTRIPRLNGGDRDAAVGTLAAFDLVISAESPVAHTLAGQLRDLKVETWALLGIPDAARPPAEIVNACATFEHAYQIIIVLNAQILRLCRALGLPSEKLRRWSDDVAGNDDDWCESLSLSFSASVSD
jgi:glycosyltransferase involved in cell wall biosynthesis